MPLPPLLGRSSLVLVALFACTRHTEDGPHATGTMSSSGLPTLSNLDGGETPPPDAAVIVTPDAAEMDLPADVAKSADLPVDPPPRKLDAPEDRPPKVIPDAAVCSSASATAKPVPVDILVVLDRSGSMDLGVGSFQGDGGFVSLTRWTSTEQALTNFVMSPAAAGLSIGLNFFPSTTSFGCDAADYARPAVPIDLLPGVAPAFIAAINATSPDGGTPTLPALQGAYLYAKQREMTLGRRTAIALATDGEPNECGSDPSTVEQAARMAAADGILTFVIGVGASLQSFNGLAMAGGTNMAYLIQNATPTELAMAFKGIQMQAARLACTFMVPPAPPGEMLDPSKVDVRFTPTANPAQSFGINIVATKADCGVNGGWYFDDLLSPTTLTLCDASCQKVNGAGEGALSLRFGCLAK
ncbi:MAG TPA: vWA domain-containing protein [Polyangia bacterium]|nr:vWA domain-containing protein [Polyangia bacterium]